MRIDIEDLSHSSSNETIIRKPAEVGRFSLDESRNFFHDRRQLSCFINPLEIDTKSDCYQQPTKVLDFNEGFMSERHIEKDDDIKEHLDNLLKWLKYNKQRFASLNSSNDQRDQPKDFIGHYPDFILYRGHMTRLMCTPFERRDGWKFACQKLNDTIYISELETDEAKIKRLNRTDRDRLMLYWGRRFEAYMTKSFNKCNDKGQGSTTNHVVNSNIEYVSVLRTRLNGRHSLVYGAETDCSLPVKILNPPDCYVELKTSRKFTTHRQKENFYRFKVI